MAWVGSSLLSTAKQEVEHTWTHRWGGAMLVEHACWTTDGVQLSSCTQSTTFKAHGHGESSDALC